MKPAYSILLCNQKMEKYEALISEYLQNGIKVLWFSKDKNEVENLIKKHKAYAQALLLLAYDVRIDDQVIIFDGQDDSLFVEKKLAVACPLFNSAQYLVEHCRADEHIVVQASAGTGKTTVMIDRIMYLLHTQPDLHLSEVYMITFTNDATNQMNKRLQNVLMKRYYLTKQKKYLRWVEEQSQMHISTIHSFAYEMLKVFGIGEGFSSSLAIRSFQHEKKEIIKDCVDADIDESKSVRNQLGIPFYSANTLINDYWSEFSKLGVAHDAISHMNWGTYENPESKAFHNVISNMVPELEDKYFEIKRQKEAIAIDDIMRDLQMVMESSVLPLTDISMKYLFIDEFQDSDLAQIRVACLMAQILGVTLFVVGDVKQSIYRFRGATDQAFSVLRKDMIEMNIREAKNFVLVNNYRTSQNVLDRMDKYFRYWGHLDKLQYDKPVIPFNTKLGKMRMIGMGPKESVEDRIVEIANEELDKLIEKVEQNEIVLNEKARVVFLTRTNKELNELSSILRRHKIPASIQREGSFYASEAVRDFYMMVSSFLFCDEPKYIFNFLLTPYAGEIESMNLNDMEWLHGDYDNLVGYLDRYLSSTSWKKYHKDFRLKPVLSVFKDILDNIPVIDNFILNSKIRKKNEGWEEKRCIAATFTEARQYEANLEKLMEIIQRNFGGDKVSLYDIYKFLKLNIASDRSESEAEVESVDDYTSILCMTVHKSKGLEFETVVIPYTSRIFPTMDRTELLVDSESNRVGWMYLGTNNKSRGRTKYGNMQNNLYRELKEKDNAQAVKEETRILYVAMTRAITNLICLVPQAKRENCWAHLIEEVGVDYE